jgi:hypothetical protein
MAETMLLWRYYLERSQTYGGNYFHMAILFS